MQAGKLGPLHRQLALYSGLAIVLVIILTVAFKLIRRVPAVRAAFAAAESSDSYAQAIEEARRAGIPVTPQALQAPLPPADQNAGPIYTQLTDLLAKRPISKVDDIAELLTPSQMPSEEQLARVRKALKHRADVMRLIHNAALRPECVFVRDWSYPNAVHMPEIGPMRTAARLLAAESELLAHDGKPLGAVSCMGFGFRIARHVENDNYLIGYMAARTIDAITLRGLQKILYSDGDKAGIADAVRSVIDKEWRWPDLARAFRSRAGATVVDLEVLRKLGPTYLINFTGDNSSKPLHFTPQHWIRFINDNGAVMLRLQRKEIAGAQLPFRQSVSALSVVDQVADNESSPMHLLVTVLTMPVADFAKRRAELQAHVDTTLAAASLLAYKNRRGSFPTTLAEALNPPPTDPFDGEALRYRREGNGFVVYSVGRNGTCTGGNPDQKPARYESDVTFHYPFPAYYMGALKEDWRPHPTVLEANVVPTPRGLNNGYWSCACAFLTISPTQFTIITL